MGISAEEFATKRANEFKSSFFSSQQSGSQTQSVDNNALRVASSDNLSDASNPKSGAAAASQDGKGADKIVYKYETESSLHTDQLKN